MRIVIVQYDIAWQDSKANYQEVSRLLNNSQQVDLIVLPEMWNTAFTMDAGPCAEKEEGPSVQQMRSWAADYDCLVTGSLIIEQGGQYYNRLLLVSKEGVVDRYDKRHLFSLAGEDDRFAAGSAKAIWHIGEWRICPMICYDLRFPVWSRNYEDYDILMYVACWPRMRHHAWATLLQARAIENQAYVIGCNRIGKDGNGFPHKGGSVMIDYKGKSTSLETDVGLLEVQIDREPMMSFRKHYPFLDDMVRD